MNAMKEASCSSLSDADEVPRRRHVRRSPKDASELGRRHHLLSNRFDNIIKNHKESKRRIPEDKYMQPMPKMELDYQAEIDNLKEELKKRFQSIYSLEKALTEQRETMTSEIDGLKVELEKRSDSIITLEETLAAQRDIIRQLRKEGGKQRNQKREELHSDKKEKPDRRRKDQQNDFRKMGDSTKSLSINPDELPRVFHGEDKSSKDRRRNFQDKKKLRTLDRSKSEPRIRMGHHAESGRTKNSRSTRTEDENGRKEETASTQVRIRRAQRSKGSSKSLLSNTATHPNPRGALRKQNSLPSSLRNQCRHRYVEDDCHESSITTNAKESTCLTGDSTNTQRRSDAIMQDMEATRKHNDMIDQRIPSYLPNELQLNMDAGKQNMPKKDAVTQHQECDKPPKPYYTPNALVISNISNMSLKKPSMLRRADGSVCTNPSLLSSASSKTPSDAGMPILSSQLPRPDNSCQLSADRPTQLISVASNTFIEQNIARR
mmetsp:Transcript_1251/g.1908  ORF Transcript_1251/g.1908 Transcript_1251/m.1908 type:complete len:490 (+) Transcript_1251:148-1617(+)